MRSARAQALIHAPLLIATVFGILAVGRALSLTIPSEFYFTFQSLFSDRAARNMVISLFGKMLAPLLVGAVLGWIIYARSGSALRPDGASASFARRLKRQWTPTIFLGGFTAAFLSAWPIIVYWDFLSNPEVMHLKPIFLILYLLYMFGYGYMALLGALGAVFASEHMGGRRDSTKLVSMAELSRVGALWLLNSGLASAAMEVITK